MIRFPYQPDLQTGVPCWRPLVPINVQGPTGRRRTKAVVDTGSNDTIFPLRLAGVVGIQLGTSITHRVVWHGQSFPLHFETVDLELSDGWAGFPREKERFFELIRRTQAHNLFVVSGP